MSTQEQHIITPESMGTWVASGFILAILALGMAMISLYRSNVTLAGTQLEIIALNQKIEDMQKKPQMPQEMAAPAAPAPAMTSPAAEQK